MFRETIGNISGDTNGINNVPVSNLSAVLSCSQRAVGGSVGGGYHLQAWQNFQP